jgi:hypothetical protein
MNREYFQNPPENLARAFADRRQFGISENARGTKKPRFAAFSRQKTSILQNPDCLAGAGPATSRKIVKRLQLVRPMWKTVIPTKIPALSLVKAPDKADMMTGSPLHSRNEHRRARSSSPNSIGAFPARHRASQNAPLYWHILKARAFFIEPTGHCSVPKDQKKTHVFGDGNYRKSGVCNGRTSVGTCKKVRVLVRNREKAANWADQGVDLVDGDWNDSGAIEQALKGVEGAFVMLPAVWAPSPDYKKQRA